jgi:pimeloyl-ACP methyl ester carboxylesterase
VPQHQVGPSIERGTGRPVVFLHGYPLTHAIFGPQLEAISRDHHVVLLDLPGFGLAGAQPVPDPLSGFAESVHGFLAEHFSVPVVLVGHSFGGYVALELVRDHPEQFAGLVLTNTRSEPDGAEAREKRWATARRLENPDEHLDTSAIARGLLSPSAEETGGPLVDTVREIVASVPSRTLVATLRAIAGRADLTPVLETIHVPTLVIWGEEDQLIPPPQSRSMVPRIRGGSGIGIPWAGHLPSLEAPEAFDRALIDILARIAAPSPH